MTCEICGTENEQHDKYMHRLDTFAAANSKVNAATLDKVAALEERSCAKGDPRCGKEKFDRGPMTWTVFCCESCRDAEVASKAATADVSARPLSERVYASGGREAQRLSYEVASLESRLAAAEERARENRSVVLAAVQAERDRCAAWACAEVSRAEMFECIVSGKSAPK